MVPPVEPPANADFEAMVDYLLSLDYRQRREFLWHRVKPRMPRFLYKFRSLDPSNTTSVEHMRDIIVRSRFWLSSPVDFNDPFDMSAQIVVDGTGEEKRQRLDTILKGRGIAWSERQKRLASIFAEVMHGKIIEELSELSVMKNFRDPVLIPIPLSSKRYRERGYNQAELICKKLIEIEEKNAFNNFKLEKNVLIKIKETEHQVNIKDRRDRLKNLSDSFSVKNPEIIKNKNIILIDDVLTTGATLTEAKKILKSFGAKKVIAFTVAH